MSIEISASILAADFLHLEEEIRSAVSSGIDGLHFDIMDGHFVPNLTFGPLIIKHAKAAAQIPFSVHLMVDNPDFYIDECLEAGATSVFVHLETHIHLHRTLSRISEKGGRAGVALNPASPLSFLPYVIDVTDEILIMTVNPGFASQHMIPSVLPKIREARAISNNLGKPVKISVDGGINLETLAAVVESGAHNVVTASAFFGAKDRRVFVEEMKKKAGAISFRP
jgi:ribulose-phosphate 3-epimerase